MNFRKGSKRQLTPTPQNGPYLWKSGACISYCLAIIPPYIYATISIKKNCNIILWKWGGKGRARLEFFQKFIPFGSRTLSLHHFHWILTSNYGKNDWHIHVTSLTNTYNDTDKYIKLLWEMLVPTLRKFLKYLGTDLKTRHWPKLEKVLIFRHWACRCLDVSEKSPCW